MTQTVILNGVRQKELAHHLIQRAPAGAVLKISPPVRSTDQNAKMWAMLSDISRSKPEGKTHTPEMWKCLFMHALKYEVQFVMGLDGHPFPVGFSTRRLQKRQFADLITFIQEYGDRHGVTWAEPNPYEEA